jgi:hypothetical protein
VTFLRGEIKIIAVRTILGSAWIVQWRMMDGGDRGFRHTGGYVWKGIWKLPVPNKVKHFIWRLAHKIIAVAHGKI